MKIYLAGPMRNCPQLNRPAFTDAAARLRALGHEVFNPAEHTAGHNVETTDDSNRHIRQLLGEDLAWICAEAGMVVTLPGWEKSAGATAEVATAKAIGIPVAGLALLFPGEQVDFPAGDDMSDLAALGETRYKDVPADDVARRVTKARERGREWWQIAQYLGLTERQARIAYGTAAERREAHRPKLADVVADLMAAIRDALDSGLETMREHSRRPAAHEPKHHTQRHGSYGPEQGEPCLPG